MTRVLKKENDFLDDLPGYPANQSPYRGGIVQLLQPVQAVSIQPDEARIIREAVYRQLLGKIRGISIGRAISEKIAEKIVETINNYRLTPEEVKELILAIHKESEEALKIFIENLHHLREYSILLSGVSYVSDLIIGISPVNITKQLIYDEMVIAKISKLAEEITQKRCNSRS